MKIILTGTFEGDRNKFRSRPSGWLTKKIRKLKRKISANKKLKTV